MSRPRRSIDLTDTRSAIYSTGEIAVGAYARHQRRQRILLALAGLALIGAAVLLYEVFRPPDESGAARYPVAVECVKCGFRGVVRVRAGEEAFPCECPKCHERSCHKLWECRNCGYQFLHRGSSGSLRCPRCGGAAVGTAEKPAAMPAGGETAPQAPRGNGR